MIEECWYAQAVYSEPYSCTNERGAQRSRNNRASEGPSPLGWWREIYIQGHLSIREINGLEHKI